MGRWRTGWCGAGRAFEIVGHDDAGPARLRDVDVAVDAAGQDQLAVCVDDFGGVAPEVLGQGRDAPVAYADIRVERVGRRGNGSSFYDQIERCHGGPPFPWYQTRELGR